MIGPPKKKPRSAGTLAALTKQDFRRADITPALDALQREAGR